MIEPPGQMLFRILGPLEAWNGREWAQVGAPQWRALLAALLLNPGQPVATGRLIADLWSDHPPAKAGNLVSVYVHRLRRLIADGSVLVTRAPGYQVLLQPGELDAERFAALVAEGRAALAGGDPAAAAGLLGTALGLWRGPALADVPASALVAAEADRLEESRVQALELRIEADLGCGRHDEVAPELRRLLADHPLREDMWALLMRALSGAGRPAQALEAYAQAREVIADELGVDPGTALQELYQDILNADAARAAAGPTGAAGAAVAGTPAPAPAAPPAQLPADIADFTGRADQVAELCALLSGGREHGSPGAVAVAQVTGSGGLGKTALAIHAAHLLADRFPDGQLYASLHGATEPVDPAEVLARFLRGLGVDGARIPAGEEERAAQFRTRLAGRRVLIVLDDARDAAQVRPLLPGSASCAALITARRAMPELVGIRLMDLDVLPAGEARALFGRVAGQARTDAEPAATGTVLAACAGLPLAIRIAGARLAARGGWNVHTLAGRLSDERRRLDELRVGNLAVRASFEVSFASLADWVGPGVSPVRAFRLLGVWTGPFIALPAACALHGQPEQAVADALEVLVDAHLLDSPEPEVYRFHDLLRVYAADRALAEESDQDRADAVGRLLTWYLHTTEAAARIISPERARVPLDSSPAGVRPLGFATLEAALNWCESERVGLVAAVRLAAQQERHEAAWKLPAAAMSFFLRRSHWADWVATHEIGLASARILGDRAAEARMLNNLGIAMGQQRLEGSVACFEQALALRREIGDAEGEARAANNVANAYFDLRRFDQALAMGEQALVLQRRAGRRYGEGVALGIIGGACRELGRHTEAVDHLQQALNISRELGDREFEAASLSDLGDAYLGLDQVGEAVGGYAESLAIWRDIGDRHGQAATLRRLAGASQRTGDAGQAVELLSEALRLCEELGDHAEAGEIRASLAETSRKAG